MKNKKSGLYNFCKRIVAIAIFLIALGTGSGTVACPLPVFQFALEYWESDPYDVVVHYNGVLSEEQQAVVNMLMDAERGHGYHPNITVILSDHSKMNHPNPSGKAMPRIEIRYPMISGIRGSLWEGPLEQSAVNDIFHSPMRQLIAEKLLKRHAGVWILLESGNASKDEKARATIEQELARLESSLKVSTDLAMQYGLEEEELHTEIDFILLTLKRDDPLEQMFINMLLGTERDLIQFDDEPIVFPVYGRGFIMYALIGNGINAWTMSDVGEFLTSTGSCQVKAESPGVDILMSFDWENKVERQSTYDGSITGSGF